MTSHSLYYRRVSSVQQDYLRQTAALVAAGAVESRIYEDKLSGTIPAEQRPGFRNMLDHLREGDEVVVTSLDRLGRTTLDILGTIERLTTAGVTVRSLKPGENFEGITGKLILTIMAAAAEWERANIAERAADARAARKAQGIKIDRKPTKLTPENVSVVRALRAQKMTIRAIAESQKMSRASVYRALDAD